MKTTSLLYKVLACAAVMAGTTSCVNDWLDQSPTTSINADGAVATTSDVNLVRTGMYSALKGTSHLIDYYGRCMFIYGDMRGEDVQYNYAKGSNRGSFYYYMTYTTADNFGSNNTPWQAPFVVIDRANRVIQPIEDGALSNAADNAELLARYEAEAKVVRAMALFDLTRIYGKPYTEDGGASLGAPIILAPVEDPYANKPARNTVAECYAQVEKDLNEAVNSGALPTDYSTDNQGYINLWAAKALQVRVYMTKGEWDNALTVAKDIINNSPYQLWTTGEYASAWGKGNSAHLKEMIFEIAINDNTDWVDREGIAYTLADPDGASPGYGDIIVSKDFATMMESDPADVRNRILLKAGGSADDYSSFNDPDFTNHGVFINKMPPYNGDVRYANVPMLRLSEVYLSAAEAAYNLHDTGTAAQMLNAIISNRTTDATKLVTAGDITLDRIYIERRKELVGEGQRYFDVLRRGETVTRYTDVKNRGWHDALTEDARTFNRDSKKALPLIPQSEINVNPNMQQNPTY